MNIEEISINEARDVILTAEERGLKPDGVWVMNQLKELGWVNASYKKFSGYKYFSNYFVRCGYSGGYNYSNLVKGFK